MSELKAVVAKMVCREMESKDQGHFKQHKVSLGAVCGKDGENKDFSNATPSGECWMQISDGRDAKEFFKPGKKYYVTFTEAPD